MSMLDEDEE
jgi:hypothetical protein